MKKLKIILLFSLLIGTSYILYTFLTCSYNSKYNLETTYIRGKILSYEIDGDNLKIEVTADEKVLIFYKISSKEEKQFYENSLSLGDVYEFYGTLSEPSINTNFNLFSYKNYLLSEKIYWVMQVNKMNIYEKNNSIFYWLKNKVNDLTKNRDTYEYLSLFIFGKSDLLDEDMLKMYRTLGISHAITVSGMHISLFSIVLLKLLKWVKLKCVRYSIVIGVLWIYSFLVGFTSSVLRSIISFTGISILNLKGYKLNSIWILLGTLFLFLLYNPFYIYNTGFLFSFVISFFLLVSSKLLNKYKNYIVKTFIISLIAFFAGIPIIAQSFFETNLLSPIVNIIFVPLISFVVFPVSLVTFVCPIIEPLFEIIIVLLEVLVSFCNKYLVISFIVPYMNIYVIIIYYVILFLIFYFQKLRYSIFIFVFLLLHSYQKFFQVYPIITMIDVGQGDSILIELPYNKANILIDTGGRIEYVKDDWQNRNTKSIAENTIIPYLKSIGVHRLDYLILSHGDYDHAGEANNLIESFCVKKILMNNGLDTELETEIINLAISKEIDVMKLSSGQLDIRDITFYFLNKTSIDNENEDSLVIYTKINEKHILLMGDAGFPSEKYILDEYNLPKMDILKVGHHGSKYSSSKEFISAISPSISLISVGDNNRYGHPNKDVINVLKDFGSDVYMTSVYGMISLILKENIIVNTCN